MVSSLPDDMQGLSRWAETWSPYLRPHCDSQQVTWEHHWKSINPHSWIVRKKLPCLQHHIITPDNLTFIYFCLLLCLSLSFPPFLTLPPLWDSLSWLLDYVTGASWILFWGTCFICTQELFWSASGFLRHLCVLCQWMFTTTWAASPVASYKQRHLLLSSETSRCTCFTVLVVC